MGIKRNILYIVLLISAYICSGCGQKKDDILVRIDDMTITVKDFEDRIAKLPSRYQDLINENKRKFLEEIVVDELLYKEALRQKLNMTKDVKEVIEAAKKKILIAKLLKEKVDDAVSVEEKDIQDYYNGHKEELVTPEVLRVSHILVKTEKEAKDILLELANSRNFEDLARTHSIDPSSERGGDIGYFTRGQLDPDFEKACFQLDEGRMSDVVKTRFGYHIIKLTERKPPSIAKYQEVKEGIRENLVKMQQKEYFNELVQRLKDMAKIIVNEESPVLGKDEKSE